MTRHRSEFREAPRRCHGCGDWADHPRTLYRAVSTAGDHYPVVRWFCADCDPDTDDPDLVA